VARGDAVEELLAQQEIRDVLARFCRGVDRGDVELVRSCYHADAYDDHGSYKGDVDGLCEAVHALVRHTVRTQHTLGQTLVELDGEAATAESYVTAHHRLPARDGRPESDLFVGARYLDRFERREGEWRIARRGVVHSWSRRVEAAPPWPGADAILQSGRGVDDPLQALLA